MPGIHSEPPTREGTKIKKIYETSLLNKSRTRVDFSKTQSRRVGTLRRHVDGKRGGTLGKAGRVGVRRRQVDGRAVPLR